MQDKSGRAYLKLADAKEGFVELDTGWCHNVGTGLHLLAVAPAQA